MKRLSLLHCVGLMTLVTVLTVVRGQTEDAEQAPKIRFISGIFENGTLLVSPDGNWTIRRNGTPSVSLLDAKTGKPVGRALRHSENCKVLCWAFSPDGKWFATGAGFRESYKGETENVGEIRVWKVVTGEQVAMFKGDIGCVRKVLFSKDSASVRYEADRFEQSGK